MLPAGAVAVLTSSWWFLPIYWPRKASSAFSRPTLATVVCGMRRMQSCHICVSGDFL